MDGISVRPIYTPPEIGATDGIMSQNLQTSRDVSPLSEKSVHFADSRNKISKMARFFRFWDALSR